MICEANLLHFLELASAEMTRLATESWKKQHVSFFWPDLALCHHFFAYFVIRAHFIWRNQKSRRMTLVGYFWENSLKWSCKNFRPILKHHFFGFEVPKLKAVATDNNCAKEKHFTHWGCGQESRRMVMSLVCTHRQKQVMRQYIIYVDPNLWPHGKTDRHWFFFLLRRIERQSWVVESSWTEILTQRLGINTQWISRIVPLVKTAIVTRWGPLYQTFMSGWRK